MKEKTPEGTGGREGEDCAGAENSTLGGEFLTTSHS